jgi:tRNA(Ile)-lysidine synthase
VTREGKGLEAAARIARYACYRALRADVIALGHQLDDQAETVLMNLLRGAGLAGASGMRASLPLGEKRLLRPLLDVSREAIVRYAKANRLEWIEDESNLDEALTRNYLRRRIGPLLTARYPRWRESLARAARHFAQADADANRMLRVFLKEQGLRAPSETKLAEMLRQIAHAKRDRRVRILHDGAELRLYRDRVVLNRPEKRASFVPIRWSGETRLALPQLGGELRFRKTRGTGIDRSKLGTRDVTVRLRSGGERLQPDAKRPRRTLKNLFQEAGIPPWERERLPLLFCGDDLVWVPGLGVDVGYRAAARSSGTLPEWKK